MSYLARHSRLLSCTKLLSTAIFIVIISASICASAGDGNDDSSQKTVKISSTQTESLTRYGDVPLAFEPNQGQAGEEVRFMSRTEGFNLLLRNREMVFRVSDPDTSKSASIVMRYMSASFRKQPQGLEKQTGVSNYLIGPNPANWHTEVPNYAKVTYEAIYPGVDLVFYGNHRSLEHDFRIAARADYKQIRVQLNEADRLTINADGDLIVKAGSGRLTFLAPKIYQLQHNKKVNVSGRYVLLAEKEFGFQLGSYDKTLPIVIDPILSYSTYLAGSSNDIASAITVDTNGNAYITGYTSSIDFPVKGAEQGKCSNTCNAQDVFVTKLNATGSALIYSTFVGGTGSDQGNAIAVDSLGNVAVAGMTSSYDFPQSNGTSVVLSTYGSHGFALSLNPSGGTFNFSTYLAGISQDSATGVAFDSTGNVYVSGYTNSSNFPVTPGHQIGPAPTGSYYGGNDIFLVKLARRGKLLFSTMVGGTSTSYYGTFPNLPVAVAVDSAGEALLCGTAYDGFPTTAGSFQQIYQGTTFGASNAFVAKLNASGTAFSSATYLGGNGSDAAIQVALDSTQNVYVAGTSYSMNFPTTPGAFQTTNLQAGQVSFITKMNPGLSSLIYSTYLGGTSSNYGRGVLATGLAVDSAGKSYVVGSSTQTDFPIASPFISEPPANYYGIGGAAFLSVLNSTGSALTFSTYFSGSTGTAGTGVAVDRGGHALITGSTSDKDLPTTSGSFQPAIPVSTYSQQHAFVAKILMTQANSSACLVNNTVWFNSLYGKPATGSFQIRNCGTSTLTVNGTVSSSPVFTVTYSNCQSVLPGASCTIKLKYVPLANSYGDNGTLTVTDNDPIPSQILQLSGYVSWPQTGIYPGYQLGFGDDVVGVTSSAVLYRVQNYGNVPLHITAVTATGDFAGVNHCPTALQSGGYCDIGATFTPTVAGPDSGTLLVYDDAQNSPQSLTLSGNGLSVYPAPSNLSMFPGSPGTTSPKGAVGKAKD